MIPSDIAQYREILDVKRAELIASLHSQEGLAIERVADEMDEVVFANERDLLIETLNRQANLLSQVLYALQRVDDGSYGVCIQCGEVISGKRLNALPWAALCLRCQEAVDDRGRTEVSSLLLHAA